MAEFALALLVALRVFFRTRRDAALEILALRHQVAVLKRKRPRPPRSSPDRLFWIILRRLWSGWAEVLVIVKPETVVGWHRAGFRLHWRWRSRQRGGRPKITDEIRGLVRRLADENPDWGAPKIHGELLKLGFAVSERTVAQYLRRIRRRSDPGKGWLAFLQNHREAMVAFDFFTVPTVIFQVLYCSFVIEHGRRRILHFNVTRHPTAFDTEVVAFLKATGLRPKQTSAQAPWRNGVAEGWVGSCRREILHHVIALNEQHLRRIIRDYANYHHDDRIHDSLDQDTPNRRAVDSRPSPSATVMSSARLGGLHHKI